MRGIIALLAGYLLLLLGGCATSVLTAPCDDPKVSNAALPSVYMVVLPYNYGASASPSDEHDQAAQALNEATGLQVLRMASEASDMHVTLLQGNYSECQIENVYQAFSKKGRLNRKLLSNVVFYWGEVYQSEDKVLIHSHQRVLWKDSDDQLITLYGHQGENAPALKFIGYLPYSTISFPPRLVSLGADSTLSARSALRAKAAPLDDAEDLPLPSKFQVMKREGKWVEVRGTSGGRSAWISLQNGGSGIVQLLPELSFANAVASYISYGQMPVDDSFKNTRKWLDEFRRGYRDGTDAKSLTRPLAIADAIEGALLLRSWRRSEYREGARVLLDKAATELATNSAVLNLAAVSEIEVCCNSREATTRIHERFQLARRLDAGNEVIARNLLNWYRLLGTKDRQLWPAGVTDVQQPARELAEVLGGQ